MLLKIMNFQRLFAVLLCRNHLSATGGTPLCPGTLRMPRFQNLLHNRKRKRAENDSFPFWQGQKDLVSPAGSVGASKHLRCLEVSTGHPHPSAHGFGVHPEV